MLNLAGHGGDLIAATNARAVHLPGTRRRRVTGTKLIEFLGEPGEPGVASFGLPVAARPMA